MPKVIRNYTPDRALDQARMHPGNLTFWPEGQIDPVTILARHMESDPNHKGAFAAYRKIKAQSELKKQPAPR